VDMKKVIVIILPVIVYALQPIVVDFTPLPKLRGDEHINIKIGPPYTGSRQSPGDQIGTTAYDLQADFSYGQRLMVDGNSQAHIDWMWQDYPGQSQRYCAWNGRFANGTYYGETQASNSWSGYVQLDITRETEPDSQRSVITYHYDAGSGYFSWIDIDEGNLWGFWSNTPRSPQVPGHIWPTVCVSNNNNILMATGDYNANQHHVYLTTDEGLTWTEVLTMDSCASLSRHLRSSGNTGSNRVVYVHTQFITDSVASGQLDNDVYYVLSTDGGVSWGPHINVTNYQPYPQDSVRAYCEVNAVFDVNDNLHITWSGRKVTDSYYEASKIFHWDEINDTITVVSSPSIYYTEPGGWWIESDTGGDYGAWRMPADMTQLVNDKQDNTLYCLWHGNDDYTDYSQDSIINGEVYGAFSTDSGISWSDYVNLTNTRTPGAGPGDCDDEDYATVHPYVVNDSIWTTYIEDKDAGAYPQMEGSLTENPVRCWVFSKRLITGIEEHHNMEPSAISLRIAPNPFVKQTSISLSRGQSAESMELKIYDATGRVVKSFPRLTPDVLHSMMSWEGTDQHGEFLPAGVYFVTLQNGDQCITKKVVKLR